MSIKAFPLNQQEYSYNAQDVMKYYAGRNSGVFETGDNLKVSANGGLELRINTGMGWLSKDYVASVAFWNESVEYLMVEAGHDTYDRIDLVVVSWNFIQQEQNPTLTIRKGTPASSPVVPSLVNDSSTIEIALARINVAKGTIALQDSDIVDLRGNDEYCPLVYDEKRIKEQFDTKASKEEVDFERKRIDNIASLPEGSTTGDAELIDIRVGANGVTYDNAGNAVRGQITELNNTKSPIGHTHDDRYYTENEIDSKVNALNDEISKKSPIGHTHDDRYYTENEIDIKVDGINSNINELKGDLDKTEDATIVKKTEDIEPAEVINGVVWYRYSETKASYYSSNKYGYKKYVVADLPSKVIITTFTLDTGLQYVFVDNDNNIILDGFTAEFRICDEVVVPKNATYLYVNFAQNYVTTEFSPYGVKGFSDFVKKEKKELSPTKAMVADGAYDGYYLFSSNSAEKAVRFTDDPNFQSYVKRVKTGDKIRLKSSYFSALAGYVLTDMTMKVYFVKHTTSSGSEAYDDTITIDRDGYVYYTAYGTSAFYEQDDLINTLGRNTDRLYGKKIFFDGDSITMASGGGVIGYVSQIERITGCITQNLAVDGGTLTSGTTVAATGSPRHHVCESILNSDADTDIYCISGGYNDFGIGQSDVGTYIEQLNSDLSVYDTTTLYGALDYIFTWLMVNRSGKPILFIMTHNPLNYRISGGSGKTANITLEQWFEAIKKMCKKYSVPYVNLFDEMPLMTKLDSLKQFTVNNDGVHPTTEGYKRYYVPKIISALHSICPIDFN